MSRQLRHYGRVLRYFMRHPRRGTNEWIQAHFPIPDPDDQKTRTELVIRTRKSVIRQNFWLLLVTAGLVVSLVNIQADRRRARMSIETSRYLSSYTACLSINLRNRNAQRDAADLLDGYPTQQKVQQLVNDLAPLREGTHRPPIPTKPPKSWKRACSAYAHQQVNGISPFTATNRN